MAHWIDFTWSPKSKGEVLFDADGRAEVHTDRNGWDILDIELGGVSLTGKCANHDLYQLVYSYVMAEYMDVLQEAARADRWGWTADRIMQREDA